MVKQLTFSDNEIYTLFHDLDRISGIMEPRLGRWHAWPAVKMQLFWPLMFETWRGNLQENSSGATAKFHNWLKAYLPCLGLAGRNFFRLRSLSGRGGNTVFMCAPRYALCPGGKRREFIFDDLTSGAGQDAPPILLAYPWPDTVRRNPLRGGEFRLDARLFAANHLAVLLAHSPSVAGPAERLLSMLDGKGLPYSHASLKRRVHSALAIFEARRRLFRRLFSTLCPQVIVTTYAPGKFGELAAAKELGIPVIELQHGMIGAGCPDYHWPDSFATYKSHMPLPDRIGVFGSLFENVLTAPGFWNEDEVMAVGGGAMDRFRDRRRSEQDGDERVHLLFMDQPTNTAEALAFWDSFFSQDHHQLPFPVTLSVKLHQGAPANLSAYKALAERVSGRLHIVPDDTHSLEAICKADFVLGYNSFALAEAVGLGVPTISLCGGRIPGGFAGSFDLPEAAVAMPHVASVEELCALLESSRKTGAGDQDLRGQMETFGKELYVPGFLESTARLINEAVEQKDGKE